MVWFCNRGIRRRSMRCPLVLMYASNVGFLFHRWHVPIRTPNGSRGHRQFSSCRSYHLCPALFPEVPTCENCHGHSTFPHSKVLYRSTSETIEVITACKLQILLQWQILPDFCWFPGVPSRCMKAPYHTKILITELWVHCKPLFLKVSLVEAFIVHLLASK